MAQSIAVDWLVSVEGQTIIQEALHFGDPLKAVATLRKQHPDIEPEYIGQAVTQATLSTRLSNRWQQSSIDALLTEDGIEQASRPLVSNYRATWIQEKFGMHAHVLDLTCGLGFDALAMSNAGLQVTCLERDLTISQMAKFNLRHNQIPVIHADATTFSLPKDIDVVFVDPARRNPLAARKADGAAHRIADPNQWSPSWSFIQELSKRIPVVAKVAPGIDEEAIKNWDCQWLSADGDLIEALTSSPGNGKRCATLLSSTNTTPLVISGDQMTNTVELGQWLVVPNAALIRARALNYLAEKIHGGLVNEHIAWLTSAETQAVHSLVGQDPSPADVFSIVAVLSVQEKLITQAVKQHPASGLTIMTRGVNIDVDTLRKKVFKQKTPGAPELILAIYRDDPTNVALLCRRVNRPQLE